MNSQTRIVILKMRTVIYTGIFIFLILILGVLLFLMFGRKGDASSDPSSAGTASAKGHASAVVADGSSPLYCPGSYHTVVSLGNQAVGVGVTVSSNRIESIQLENLDNEVKTTYPLLEPAMTDLKQQILAAQTTEGLCYQKSMQYTQSALLESIHTALQKASVTN